MIILKLCKMATYAKTMAATATKPAKATEPLKVLAAPV